MTTLRRTTLLAGVLLLGGALLAPVALAHSGHGGVQIVLEAGEGDDCSGDKNFCYSVTEGDLSKVTAGASVELTLENPSSNSITHNAHVADLADASKGGGTSASAAFANTTDVDNGNSASINFTVPDGVDTTYIWCTIGAHESGGMWLTAGSTGGGGDGANGSPGFTAVGALAALGVALVAARRLQ